MAGEGGGQMKKKRGTAFHLLYWAKTICLFLIIAVMMSGCLYPKERRQENQGAIREGVRNVQAAVDDFQKNTGLLPIITSDASTPKYEKYKVDFSKLQGKGFLGSIPSSAFENGGNYFYLIIDEETEPKVKLMDLITVQKINDLQNQVTTYMKQTARVPKGELKYNSFYYVDYDQLKIKEPSIISSFSGQTLEAIVDEYGFVYADYGIDIMQFIQNKQPSDEQLQGDLRELLTNNSDYVPVKAPVYHYINNEPAAVLQLQK